MCNFKGNNKCFEKNSLCEISFLDKLFSCIKANIQIKKLKIYYWKQQQKINPQKNDKVSMISEISKYFSNSENKMNKDVLVNRINATLQRK